MCYSLCLCISFFWGIGLACLLTVAIFDIINPSTAATLKVSEKNGLRFQKFQGLPQLRGKGGQSVWALANWI